MGKEIISMNVDEIRKWHKTFKRDDELFEIRLLGDRTWSGYFYDVEQAIEKLQPFDNLNIYFSVNEVKRACASRSQFGQFQQVKGTATSKQDIEHRWWIPIDVDCERPSGVSSTDEEKSLAHKKAGDIYRFLKANGFRLDKTDDWPLNGRSYSVDAVCPMIRGKFLRSLYWNPTDTPMKYSNCKIGQIEIDVKSRYKLILPGGLKFDINTTPQDVLDMYGDPYRLSEQDTYTEITYMQGEFSRVDFYFYTQDEKMKENNYVILQNFAG